jgi:hypothetical protein
MELLDGLWLDAYVQEHHLPLAAILRLMQAVCDAIQHAHQNGVIHRDLKPSNILVTKDGQPHVVDFGLAAAVTREEGAGAMSFDGEVTGTPAYMSPEQAAGRPEHVDTRTDVYSLGVVFYRLVTGSFPYDVSASMLQTLENIRQCDPVRPSKLAPHLDRDTEAVILKALEKEPDRRYQAVAELKADIGHRLAGLPVLARSDSSFYVLRKIIARHKYTSTVAALLGVIVLGFVAFSLQLSMRLRQTHRDLVEQKDLFAMEMSQFTRYANTAILTAFLDRWHKGDRQAVNLFAHWFGPGTPEALAVQFLGDERPLSEKRTKFEPRLRDSEPWFVQFVFAEQYLKDGNKSEAIKAYRACLSHKNVAQTAPWLAVWVGNRLYGLTGAVQSDAPAAPGEGHEP